mgnify:CR=1 FL=1
MDTPNKVTFLVKSKNTLVKSQAIRAFSREQNCSRPVENDRLEAKRTERVTTKEPILFIILSLIMCCIGLHLLVTAI